MSKPIMPARVPLPSGLELFRIQLWLMAELTGACKDAYVRDALHDFDNVILRRISTSITKRAAVVKQRDALRFMEIFKHNYLMTIDFPYDVDLKSVDFPIIEKVVAKLEAEGVGVEEYMRWVFDDFVKSRGDRVAVNHKLVCSNMVVQEFFTKNADLIKDRRAAKREGERHNSMLAEARALYRETSDGAFLSLMDRRGKGEIDWDMFSAELISLKKKHGK